MVQWHARCSRQQRYIHFQPRIWFRSLPHCHLSLSSNLEGQTLRGGQGYQESCYIVSLFTWNDICWYFVLVHTVIVRILNPMPQDMRKYYTNSWHTQMALVVSSTYFIPKYHLVVIDTKSIANYLS